MKRNITRAAFAAACFILAGCSGNYVSPAERQAVDQLKALNNGQLCQAREKVTSAPAQYGGVATMPRDEFDIYYAQSKYLRERMQASGIQCDTAAATKAPKATRAPVELTPAQQNKRALYACDSYADGVQVANPSAAFEMCRRGYNATPAKCKRDAAEFTRQAQTLTGVSRAEFIELGGAFRAGCNLK